MLASLSFTPTVLGKHDPLSLARLGRAFTSTIAPAPGAGRDEAKLPRARINAIFDHCDVLLDVRRLANRRSPVGKWDLAARLCGTLVPDDPPHRARPP